MYKLLAITPEEYIQLGDAGAWVYAGHTSTEDTSILDERSDSERGDWNQGKYRWAHQFLTFMTRMECDE